MKKSMKKYLHAITLEIGMARRTYAFQYKEGYMFGTRKYDITLWWRIHWKLEAILSVAFGDSDITYQDCKVLMRLCDKLSERIDSCYEDC